MSHLVSNGAYCIKNRVLHYFSKPVIIDDSEKLYDS